MKCWNTSYRRRNLQLQMSGNASRSRSDPFAWKTTNYATRSHELPHRYFHMIVCGCDCCMTCAICQWSSAQPHCDIFAVLKCQAISQERNQLRHELQQAVAAGQAMIHSQPQLPEPVATATASTRATQPVATQHSPTHQRLEMLMLLPPVMWSVDQVAEWMTLQPPQSGIHQYASIRGVLSMRCTVVLSCLMFRF